MLPAISSVYLVAPQEVLRLQLWKLARIQWGNLNQRILTSMAECWYYVIGLVLMYYLCLSRRQVQTPSRPSRSLSSITRVVRRGEFFPFHSWTTEVIFDIFYFVVSEPCSALDEIHNRSRKPWGRRKWKFFWFLDEVAAPSMASFWKFDSLCCCKQLVHVLCIKIVQEGNIFCLVNRFGCCWRRVFLSLTQQPLNSEATIGS